MDSSASRFGGHLGIDTLNYEVARENDDERHICPLHAETVRRCVRLWSNPGDVKTVAVYGHRHRGPYRNGAKVGGSSVLNSKLFQPSGKNIRAAVKRRITVCMMIGSTQTQRN